MPTRRGRTGFGIREIVLGLKGPMRKISSEAKDRAPGITYCKHLRLQCVCFESELRRAVNRRIAILHSRIERM